MLQPSDHRPALKAWIADSYKGRRAHSRVISMFGPETLTEDQIDNLISACSSTCKTQHRRTDDYQWAAEEVFGKVYRPVGFGWLTWFMIGKALLEIILLFWNYSESIPHTKSDT